MRASRAKASQRRSMITKAWLPSTTRRSRRPSRRRAARVREYPVGLPPARPRAPRQARALRERRAQQQVRQRALFRKETDLEALSDDLVGVASETMHPAYI